MAWPLLEYHTTNSGGYRNEKSAKKESSNKKIKLKCYKEKKKKNPPLRHRVV